MKNFQHVYLEKQGLTLQIHYNDLVGAEFPVSHKNATMSALLFWNTFITLASAIPDRKLFLSSFDQAVLNFLKRLTSGPVAQAN